MGARKSPSQTTQHEDQERAFEIGKDEAWFANVKRTYDEFLQLSVESYKRDRTIVDKMLSDAQQSDNVRQNIANQALQNAVETANMIGKQTVRHGDIAVDRQWNVDEQGYTVEQIVSNKKFQDALGVLLAEALKNKSK